MSARVEALKDIKETIANHFTYNEEGWVEVWNVGVSKLDTTHNRRLNKLVLK